MTWTRSELIVVMKTSLLEPDALQPDQPFARVAAISNTTERDVAQTLACSQAELYCETLEQRHVL